MQSRAQAMFDAKKRVLEDIANKLMRNASPRVEKAYKRAKKLALEEWAMQEFYKTRVKYVVDVEKGMILPANAPGRT